MSSMMLLSSIQRKILSTSIPSLVRRRAFDQLLSRLLLLDVDVAAENENEKKAQLALLWRVVIHVVDDNGVHADACYGVVRLVMAGVVDANSALDILMEASSSSKPCQLSSLVSAIIRILMFIAVNDDDIRWHTCKLHHPLLVIIKERRVCGWTVVLHAVVELLSSSHGDGDAVIRVIESLIEYILLLPQASYEHLTMRWSLGRSIIEVLNDPLTVSCRRTMSLLNLMIVYMSAWPVSTSMERQWAVEMAGCLWRSSALNGDIAGSILRAKVQCYLVSLAYVLIDNNQCAAAPLSILLSGKFSLHVARETVTLISWLLCHGDVSYATTTISINILARIADDDGGRAAIGVWPLVVYPLLRISQEVTLPQREMDSIKSLISLALINTSDMCSFFVLSQPCRLSTRCLIVLETVNALFLKSSGLITDVVSILTCMDRFTVRNRVPLESAFLLVFSLIGNLYGPQIILQENRIISMLQAVRVLAQGWPVELSTRLICVLRHRLAHIAGLKPSTASIILYSLPAFASHKSSVGSVLEVLSNMTEVSPLLLPVSMRVLCALWEQQPRVFPHLLAMLTKGADSRTNLTAISSSGCEIALATAACLDDICRTNPNGAGRETLGPTVMLLSTCMDVGTSSHAPVGAIAALCLNALTELCDADALSASRTLSILRKHCSDVEAELLSCTSNGNEKLLGAACGLLGSVASKQSGSASEEVSYELENIIKILVFSADSGQPVGVRYEALKSLARLPSSLLLSDLSVSNNEVVRKSGKPNQRDGKYMLSLLLSSVRPLLVDTAIEVCHGILSSELDMLGRRYRVYNNDDRSRELADSCELSPTADKIIDRWRACRQQNRRSAWAGAALFSFHSYALSNTGARDRRERSRSYNMYHSSLLDLLVDVRVVTGDWIVWAGFIAPGWASFMSKLIIAYTEAMSDDDFKISNCSRVSADDDFNSDLMKRWSPSVFAVVQDVFSAVSTAKGSPSVVVNALFALAGCTTSHPPPSPAYVSLLLHFLLHIINGSRIDGDGCFGNDRKEEEFLATSLGISMSGLSSLPSAVRCAAALSTGVVMSSLSVPDATRTLPVVLTILNTALFSTRADSNHNFRVGGEWERFGCGVATGNVVAAVAKLASRAGALGTLVIGDNDDSVGAAALSCIELLLGVAEAEETGPTRFGALFGIAAASDALAICRTPVAGPLSRVRALNSAILDDGKFDESYTTGIFAESALLRTSVLLGNDVEVSRKKIMLIESMASKCDEAISVLLTFASCSLRFTLLSAGYTIDDEGSTNENQELHKLVASAGGAALWNFDVNRRVDLFANVVHSVESTSILHYAKISANSVANTVLQPNFQVNSSKSRVMLWTLGSLSQLSYLTSDVAVLLKDTLDGKHAKSSAYSRLPASSMLRASFEFLDSFDSKKVSRPSICNVLRLLCSVSSVPSAGWAIVLRKLISMAPSLNDSINICVVGHVEKLDNDITMWAIRFALIHKLSDPALLPWLCNMVEVTQLYSVSTSSLSRCTLFEALPVIVSAVSPERAIAMLDGIVLSVFSASREPDDVSMDMSEPCALISGLTGCVNESMTGSCKLRNSILQQIREVFRHGATCSDAADHGSFVTAFSLLMISTAIPTACLPAFADLSMPFTLHENSSDGDAWPAWTLQATNCLVNLSIEDAVCTILTCCEAVITIFAARDEKCMHVIDPIWSTPFTLSLINACTAWLLSPVGGSGEDIPVALIESVLVRIAAAFGGLHQTAGLASHCVLACLDRTIHILATHQRIFPIDNSCDDLTKTVRLLTNSVRLSISLCCYIGTKYGNGGARLELAMSLNTFPGIVERSPELSFIHLIEACGQLSKDGVQDNMDNNAKSNVKLVEPPTLALPLVRRMFALFSTAAKFDDLYTTDNSNNGETALLCAALSDILSPIALSLRHYCMHEIACNSKSTQQSALKKALRELWENRALCNVIIT